MTNLTHKAQQVFARDRYATELTGVSIDLVESRHACCSLTLLPPHRNAMGAVMGGVNPFIPMSEGELNPYSWFVTLLRRLMGMDDGTPTPPVPDRGTPENKRW